MNFKKSDYKLIIIVIFLVIICFFIFNLNQNKNNETPKEENKILLLKDYSRFFTINSCVYKYIVNLQSKNTKDLLILLDEEYKDRNKIDQTNIYNYLEDLNGNYTFDAKKIYYKTTTSNVITYYVYGNILEDTINGLSTNKMDAYYVLKMDTKNKTFSIAPYSGDIFKEDKNE